jgi:hypothetical protein
MSQTSYESFLVEVMPYVRDVPEIVAIQAIRNACIQFCEETMYLQTNLDPQPLVEGVATYDLTPDNSSYRVVNVVEAWNGDQFLIPKSVEELTRIYRVTNWETLEGNPYYYFRPTEDEMRLVPMPSVSNQSQLRVKAAIAPTRSSTTIDSEIYERFLEYISFGARGRLYDTPNQPYYDPKAAQIYLKRFNDAIAEVRARVNRGNVRASNRIEFQRWA